MTSTAPNLAPDSQEQKTVRLLAHIVRQLSPPTANVTDEPDVSWLGAPSNAEQLVRALQLHIQTSHPGWAAPYPSPVVDLLGRLREETAFFRHTTADPNKVSASSIHKHLSIARGLKLRATRLPKAFSWDRACALEDA